MSDNFVRKGNSGIMVVVKILAIVAMVSSAVILVRIMRNTYKFSFFGVLNALISNPVILFVVYLFTGYSKNKNKLLGAYFLVGAIVLTLSNIILAFQYVEITMYNMYSTSLWSSYDTYYLVQINSVSLLANIYTMFTIDAFLNFRLVKASRVLSIVTLATTILTDLIMRGNRLGMYAYPDAYWVVRWLMPVCLILFYFGAVDGYRPEPKPAVAPIPTPVRMPAPVPMPAPARVPAPMPMPAPVVPPTAVPMAQPHPMAQPRPMAQQPVPTAQPYGVASAEEALYRLRQQWESGQLSREEYEFRRNELIQKL